MAGHFFLLLSAATLALAQTPATKRPIHIDGTVVERETHAPIANAKITLVATENSDQQATTSDANGRFSFNTIEAAGSQPLGVRPGDPLHYALPNPTT